MQKQIRCNLQRMYKDIIWPQLRSRGSTVPGGQPKVYLIPMIRNPYKDSQQCLDEFKISEENGNINIKQSSVRISQIRKFLKIYKYNKYIASIRIL